MYKNKSSNKLEKKDKKIILEKSDKKDKRFKVIMQGFDNMKDHSHSFGAKNAKTYIDSRTDKEKKAWIARHKDDKGFNNKHSGIFYSKNLLWGESKSLKKNIKNLEKKLNVKIIDKT